MLSGRHAIPRKRGTLWLFKRWPGPGHWRGVCASDAERGWLVTTNPRSLVHTKKSHALFPDPTPPRALRFVRITDVRESFPFLSRINSAPVIAVNSAGYSRHRVRRTPSLRLH
jgi:hypothetical protein